MQEKYLKSLKKLYDTNLFLDKKENLNNLLYAAEAIIFNKRLLEILI